MLALRTEVEVEGKRRHALALAAEVKEVPRARTRTRSRTVSAERVLKLLSLGHAAAGKTTFIRRCVEGVFAVDVAPTLGLVPYPAKGKHRLRTARIGC